MSRMALATMVGSTRRSTLLPEQVQVRPPNLRSAEHVGESFAEPSKEEIDPPYSWVPGDPEDVEDPLEGC